MYTQAFKNLKTMEQDYGVAQKTQNISQKWYVLTVLGIPI